MSTHTASGRLRALSALAAVSALTVLMGPPLVDAAGGSAMAVDLTRVLLPPLSGPHLLGTDELGRDVLARLLLGARVSLLVGMGAALLAGALGSALVLGATAAGPRAAELVRRLTDAGLSLPVLPVVMVAGVWLGQLPGASALPPPWNAAVRSLLLLAGFGALPVARLAQALVARQLTAPFVDAARACGVPPWRLMWDHILPHVAPGIMVMTAAEVSGNILYEAALGFLGVGLPSPHPSLGGMLAAAPELMHRAPLLLVWPGLTLTLACVWAALVADTLRDALAARPLRP